MVKNRKGTSHVEIILSVVIFLAFVGIALYFFSPKNTDRVIGTTQEYAFREIEKQASVVLETYGVNLNQIGPIGVGIDEIGGGGVRVENSAENVLSSGRTGEIVCINGGGNEFVYIYVSEDFSSSGCGLSNGDYTLASSNSRKVVSEKKLKLLQSKYNSDYSGLKEEFNLPGRVEFGLRGRNFCYCQYS